MAHTAGRLRLLPGRVRLPECGPAGTPAPRARGLPGRGRRQLPPPPPGRRRQARTLRAECRFLPAAALPLLFNGRRCRSPFAGRLRRRAGRSSRLGRDGVAGGRPRQAGDGRRALLGPPRRAASLRCAPAAPLRFAPWAQSPSLTRRGPLRVRPAAQAGLSGRFLPPTPASPGAAMRVWGGVKERGHARHQQLQHSGHGPDNR